VWPPILRGSKTGGSTSNKNLGEVEFKFKMVLEFGSRVEETRFDGKTAKKKSCVHVPLTPASYWTSLDQLCSYKYIDLLTSAEN
jgi:hypothetical protein